MIEVIFKIFLTDYIDFQGFITKRIQKPLLIEYKSSAKRPAILPSPIMPQRMVCMGDKLSD
jgi:hypothetical protein